MLIKVSNILAVNNHCSLFRPRVSTHTREISVKPAQANSKTVVATEVLAEVWKSSHQSKHPAQTSTSRQKCNKKPVKCNYNWSDETHLPSRPRVSEGFSRNVSRSMRLYLSGDGWSWPRHWALWPKMLYNYPVGEDMVASSGLGTPTLRGSEIVAALSPNDKDLPEGVKGSCTCISNAPLPISPYDTFKHEHPMAHFCYKSEIKVT